MIMIRLLLILLLLHRSIFSFAQVKDVALINITRQEGLPSNETYCVFKDSKNYIWIATDQGVVRYKGASIQLINTLPDNVIFKIREDNKGRVWFFSHTGKLAYFFNEKVYPFIYNDSIVKYVKNILINEAYITGENEIFLNSIRTAAGDNIKIDSRGNVEKNYEPYDSRRMDTCVVLIKNWPGRQLFIELTNPLSPYNFFSYPLKIVSTYYGKPVSYQLKGLKNSLVQFGAFVTKQNELVCWFDEYLVKLNKDGTYKVKELPKKILSAFLDTINNTIITGFAKGGIAVLNTQFEVLEANLLNNYSVTAVEMDNEGELWFSTLENGVYYTKNSNRQKQFIEKKYSGHVQRMAAFHDSLMLFANGDGLFKLSGNKVSAVLSEKNIAVGDILPGAQNIVYYARMGLFGVDMNFRINRSADPEIGKIITFTSSKEILNFSNKVLGVNRYTDFLFLKPGDLDNRTIGITDLSTAFPFKGINVSAAILKDSNTMLMGTKNALLKADVSSHTYRAFNDSVPLFSKGVTHIRRMDNSIFAIAIRFGGLALVQDSSLIGNITEADGLLSNSITYILPVGNRLWLATPNGISVIEFSSYQPLHYSIKNFAEETGLHNMVIYQLLSFKDNIWAATSKGMYALTHIEKILQEQPAALPFYITTINYYKGDTSGISHITLPYYNNRLTVNFDAICYNTPKELLYYYRLTGNNSDTSWRNISSTQIVLENIAPGSYTVQIKAAMPKQKRYSAILALHIVVDKPWWQLTIVRIAALLSLLLIVYALYRWRIGIIKKRETEKTTLKKQMTELEQTALRSQMNPHFIFNCLSSIQQLVVTGDKDEANEYLVKFSRLIRKTLELSASPYISIAQEKEYLSEYLVLEQLRIPNHFDFAFTIDGSIDIYKTEIPNMMLQPIVENCIRHGIKHLQNRKGVIHITLIKINDCIRCKVVDNGIGRRKIATGMPLTPHKSYGMGIVEKRLTGLPHYDPADYFLQVEDVVDVAGLPAGTTVILQVPYKINEL